MRKYLNYKLPVFGMMVALLASCYSDQNVAPIDSPDDNPTITVEPSGDYSTLTEGDVLEYTISVDRMLPNDIAFTVEFGDESVAGAADFSTGGAILGAYTLSTTIAIEVVDDHFPEVDEAISFEINADGYYAWNWLLNPGSDKEATTGTIVNTYVDSVLSIGVQWPDDHDDWDGIVFATADTSAVSTAFTGADPELMSIDNDEDDGEYVVVMDAYAVAHDETPFYTAFNTPDGGLAEVETTVVLSDESTYTLFAGYYVVARIVKSGSSYSVSAP